MALEIYDNRKKTKEMVIEDEKDLSRELYRSEKELDYAERMREQCYIDIYTIRIEKLKMYTEMHNAGALTFPVRFLCP